MNAREGDLKRRGPYKRQPKAGLIMSWWWLLYALITVAGFAMVLIFLRR